MSQMSKKLVFFGSGPVGLASVRGLSGDFEIEAVITKPNPAGRRAQAPVAEWANQNSITLYQPQNKQDLSELFKKTKFESRVGVVVDYGIIISKDVFESFEKGIVNSHFSLLPEWRGADPISFSILSGQETTGVSLMVIDEELDTGELIDQQKLAVEDNNIDELTTRLVNLSIEMLKQTLPKYLDGEIEPSPQPDTEATYSHKLTKSDGEIDWTKPAIQIEREIRAYLGWPGSYTQLAQKPVTITEARVIEENGKAGEITKISKSRFAIYCSENALEVIKIKPAGKPEMTAAGFMAGYSL